MCGSSPATTRPPRRRSRAPARRDMSVTELGAASAAAATARPLLEVERLSKRFMTHEGEVHALDTVSLDVRQGEFVGVIGPSGCGKSTLFNIIGGLIGDYQGTVRVNGATVSGSHREIGMVFQEESTFP